MSDAHRGCPWLGRTCLENKPVKNNGLPKARFTSAHVLQGHSWYFLSTDRMPGPRHLMSSLRTEPRAGLPRRTPHCVTLGKWLAFSELLLLWL